MNDVPLIQKADINSINTSIIAIKKQLKQLTEAVGLIDVPDIPDLSPFVKKTDVVDVVEADNMNPVTSNAVYEAIKEELLWENPDPTSNFNATNLTSQTLGKDLSKYFAIYVYVKNVTAGGQYNVCKCYKGLLTALTAPAATYVHTRDCTLTDTQITIGVGYATSTANGTYSVNNAVAIPVKIWGVKGV